MNGIHYAETKYGFEYGAARIERCASDDKRGWVVLMLSTPKYKEGNSLQIYVTKTGKVRISDKSGKWKPVAERASKERKDGGK